jgi:endonuclease/exonuclease/phosphatase family metal-dependent hydrolase
MNGQELDNLSFGEDDSFDVMTWNLEDFPKSGSITIDSVRKIIDGLEIDVIGMQEIDDTTALREVVDGLDEYEMFIAEGFFTGLVYVYNKNTVQINSAYKIYTAFQYWDIFLRAPVVMECSFMNQDFVLINNHYKCCGDGDLEIGNLDDEEGIRYESNTLLKEYIDLNLPNEQVILMGDLNDNIVDIPVVNVFQMFFEDEDNYLFADIDIAFGSSAFWSFPNWPSHLDHILITNELFEEFENSESEIKTLRIDDFMLGLNHYDNRISDHRPVALKLKGIPVSTDNSTKIVNDIKLYPNPTPGAFTIDVSGFNSPVKIEVKDVMGNTVVSQDYSSPRSIVEITMEGTAGIYFVFVESEDKKGVVRVIKN